MPEISLIPKSEFDRLRAAEVDRLARLSLLADMCRANTLATVKRAGSGHLGSSFSSLDIVAYLYYHLLNTAELGPGHPDRDVYFSSKGHDAPGLYAVLHSLGVVPEGMFLDLRRQGGTCGHPDLSTPGMEACTGSLGMGVSKGKGMLWAKQLLGRGGRVLVMTGDGELQEGQIYEALMSAARLGLGRLTVIVDHNKVQSDRPVTEITDLGDLEERFRAFGWATARCDGHDMAALEAALARLAAAGDRPGILIADTIKGRGVSFMEHPAALAAGGGLYRWHSGAPDDESFAAGHAEIIARVRAGLAGLGLEPLRLVPAPPADKAPSGVTREYVADAYGQALVELGSRHPGLVVLDADLSADCRLRGFEGAFPARFIENGIAEQDMVSTAGGLALQGLLPVVNSFASFLASRANEQIYTNLCEGTRIIYACHYAGLIPAGPGHSHQSVRDISLFGALPGLAMLQPCNGEEARQALAWCVEQAPASSMLRLNIGPSPRAIELPAGYQLTLGQGAALAEGGDALLLAYGPVMLNEALSAHELLAGRGFGLKVVNMPWLNRVDPAWLTELLGPFARVFVLEDHSPVGGLGDFLLGAMMDQGLCQGRRLVKLGVEGVAVCGTPAQALAHHGLDGASLARRIAGQAGGAR